MTCRRLAYVPLLLALSVAAGAQPRPQADCTTPRRAVVTWLGNLQADNDRPQLATRCFDWAGAGVEARAERERLARQLKAVLDQRGLYVDVDALPDTPEVAADELDDGRLPIVRRLEGVELVKVGDRWKVSAETIALIPELYAATFRFDVEAFVERLPAWMRAPVLPGAAVWQLLGLLVAIFAGLVVRLAFAKGVAVWGARLLRMRGQSADATILQRTANPTGTVAMAGLLWWMLPLLRFPVRVNQVGLVALRVIAASATVLLVYRLVDLGADVFARRAARTESKFDDQIVPLVRKTLKVFVAVMGVIFVLQNLDIDVGSLLAGVSLGGLAFTLAAKDTVANLFGSVSIFADQPFQIGDWVKIGEHEGIIEEVGMRSTRVRTFYDSVISIPNQTVANAAIDNFGRRRYRRCMLTVGLTYDTAPDQMQAFVEGVRAILKANPNVRQDAYEVAFRDFGDSALEVLVYFFLRVPSWTEELKQRQNVLLEIMRLAEAIGVDFAFPTQTLHVETLAEPTKLPARQAPPRRALQEIVESFGPEGSRARPEPEPLTSGYWPDPPKG